MRDPVLNQAIKQLAAEAATRYATLVASGDQIPFDVDEQAGPESPFHSYRPLTSEYVLEREDELRSLPGFEAALDAVAVADVAAPYLEGQGAAVPVDSGERAARMLVTFFAALWDGCTEFSLDRARLDGALALLDAELCDVDETDFLIAPIVGLQMALPRLHLPHGMQAVRADAIEAPTEAMRSEGMGRQAWEPQFLAIAELGEGAESAAEAMRQLHELITVMRLFKQGGVGLGPVRVRPDRRGGLETGRDRSRRGPPRRLPADQERGRGPRRVRLRPRGQARPRRGAGLGGRPLRDGARPRLGDGGPERPPAGAASDARRRGSGRRLAAETGRGADRGRPGRQGRLPRADRGRDRPRAIADAGRAAGGHPRARRLDRGRRPRDPARGRARSDQPRPRHRRRRVADRPRARRGRLRDHRLRLDHRDLRSPRFPRLAPACPDAKWRTCLRRRPRALPTTLGTQRRKR